MSTSKKEFSEITNRINLLYKFEDDLLFCRTIDYKEKKINNIDDLEEYIKNNRDLNNIGLNIIHAELEYAYLSRIIASYSKTYNKGVINWQYNYNDLSFKRMNKLVSFLPISVIVHVQPDMGSAIGMSTIKTIITNAIKSIYYIIKEIRLIRKTYIFFEENYGYSKEFIQKTIKLEYEWKKGFIDNNIYSNKSKYEKKIMKDCNYRYNRKNKIWRKKED